MAKIFNIIVVSIIIGISGFFIIYPKYQDVVFLESQAIQKKADIYNKEARLDNLEKLSAQLQQYEEKLRKIDAALPTEPSFPTLFAFLQRTVAENGLILENINFTPVVSRKKQDISSSEVVAGPSPGQGEETGMEGEGMGMEGEVSGGLESSTSEVQDIYFTFNSTGSYEALKNFIFSLERSSKIWEIVSLSISSSSDSQGTESTETVREDESAGLSAGFNIKTHSY